MLGWAAAAVACGIGLSMSGGKEGPASAKDTVPLFHISKADEPKANLATKSRQDAEPPDMTCTDDRQHCWWTDLGRPDPSPHRRHS
jgi:hypothetical protein